jgi:heparanase 1
MLKRFLLGVVVLVAVIVALAQLLLTGGRGGLPAFIAAQRPPQPRDLPADAAVRSPVGEYGAEVTVDLAAPAATVAPEFLSFAIDMSQVVGGKWWDPAAAGVETGSGTVAATQLDFNRVRLDRMVQALKPAYLRVGGSESDKAYYALDGALPTEPPPGFESVLTRERFDDVLDFAQRNGLPLVFTLNAGPGNRTPEGAWDGSNAAALMRYAATRGAPAAVYELGNELNIFWFVHGLGAQVRPRQYTSDLLEARRLIGSYSPNSKLGAQGSAICPILGEPLGLLFGYLPDYLRAGGGDVVDIVSWRYYPQQSRRGPIASRRASPARLLSPDALDEAGYWARKMNGWRDRYAAGRPVWLAETGNAQFGGEPGLSDAYLGGLWWLDELGLLAREGQQVVVRQTLAGSDYGMIDPETLDPRPDYWNSVLWKRLMGREVYAVDVTGDRSGRLRAYAHATPGPAGSVTVLLINLDPARAATVSLLQFAGSPYALFCLDASDLYGRELRLNGAPLALGADGALPLSADEGLNGAEPRDASGQITLAPLTYAFVVFPTR